LCCCAREVAGNAVKTGGDFPAFWSNDHSFIDAMEAIYQEVRKREKDW